MTLKTRPVRLSLLSRQAAPLAGAKVNAQLSLSTPGGVVLPSYEIDGADVVPLVVTMVEDPDKPGDYLGNFWPNTRGDKGTRWLINVAAGELLMKSLNLTVIDGNSTVVVPITVEVDPPPYPQVFPSARVVSVAQGYADAAGLSASLAVQAAQDAVDLGLALGDVEAAAGFGQAAAQAAGEAVVAAVQADAARDLAQAASIASAMSLAAKDTIALGRASVANGQTFWVKPNATDGLVRYTNYLRTDAANQTFVADQITGAEFDGKVGVTPFGVDLSVAIVDETGRRSWLEADLSGGPSANAALRLAAALVYEELSASVKSQIAAGIRFLDTLAEAVPDVAISIVDEGGRRSWLEVAVDGGPTANALDVIGRGLMPSLADQLGLAVAIVDESGRRSWLEAGLDGGPTPNAIALLQPALGIGGASPTRYAATVGGETFPISSGPDIVCWGDSMTAGAGGNGTTFANVLAGLSGRVVRNAGVGGETSVTICSRSGATPFLVNVQGGVIPASGSVAVTFSPIGGIAPAPLLQGSGTPDGDFSGVLAGVPGVISQASGAYSFTRASAGSAVTCNRPTSYRTAWSQLRRGDVAIFWVGQNGPSDARSIQDVKAMVGHLTALDKRWLVIPKPTSTDAFDDLVFSEFGRRAIMARK